MSVGSMSAGRKLRICDRESQESREFWYLEALENMYCSIWSMFSSLSCDREERKSLRCGALEGIMA